MKLPQMQIEAWWDKAHLLYGPLYMNNKLPVARNEHLNKVYSANQHIHSANKQFFEIGKV